MSKESQSINPSSEEEWDRALAEVDLTARVEQSGIRLHNFKETAMELPMNRFLTISTAEVPQPWIARQAMKEAQIPEGDMMNIAARTALYMQTSSSVLEVDEGENTMDGQNAVDDLVRAHMTRTSGTENTRVFNPDLIRVRKQVRLRKFSSARNDTPAK